MFNWLKRKATAKLTAVQAAEVYDWTRKLRSLDSSTIGAIVAASANVRNEWLLENRVDLLLSHLVIHDNMAFRRWYCICVIGWLGLIIGLFIF